MSYQEGSSWSAYEGLDTAYVGGPHDYGLTDVKNIADGADPEAAANYSFPLTFGCQIRLTGLFKTQLADGIMGMDNAGASFWAQMNSKNVIKDKIFSLCFIRQNRATRDGTQAGALTLGGTDPRLHSNHIVWSQNIRSSGFYTVRLKKMYLREGGGVSAEYDNKKKIYQLSADEGILNSGGVIVDSGTTDTYMTQQIGATFKAIWKDITGNAYSHEPVKLTDKQIDALPTILFQIAPVGGKENGDPSTTVGLAGGLDGDNPLDIVIAMPASHYMEYDSTENRYIARLYLEERSGSVLGANLMMGHDVVFDIDGGKIGWAESDCDYGLLVGDDSLVAKRKNDSEDGGGGKCKGAGCIIGVIFGVFAALLCCCLLCLAGWRYRDQREKVEPRELDDLEFKDEGDYLDGEHFSDTGIEIPSSIGDGTQLLRERQEDGYDDGVGYEQGSDFIDGDDGYDQGEYDDQDRAYDEGEGSYDERGEYVEEDERAYNEPNSYDEGSYEGEGTDNYDAGTMASGYDDGTMASGYDAGTMASGYDAGTMASGYDDGTMASGYDARTMASGYDAGTMASGYDAGTMASGYDDGTMASGYDDGTMASGYDAGTANDAGTVQSEYDTRTLQSEYHAGTVQSEDDEGTIQSGYDAGTVHSGYDAGTAASGYDARTMASEYDEQTAASGYDARTAAGGYNAETAVGEYDEQTAASKYDAGTAVETHLEDTVASGYNSGAIAGEYDEQTAASGHHDGSETSSNQYDEYGNQLGSHSRSHSESRTASVRGRGDGDGYSNDDIPTPPHII